MGKPGLLGPTPHQGDGVEVGPSVRSHVGMTMEWQEFGANGGGSRELRGAEFLCGQGRELVAVWPEDSSDPF